ncbi:18423_t:CDS:2, partial [Racocetra persica]
NNNQLVASTNDSDQKTDDKNIRPTSNITKQKEGRTNLLQATFQKVFHVKPSVDKPKTSKSSKNSVGPEDERTEKKNNTRPMNPSASKPRFQKLNNGSHVHNLKPKKVYHINNLLKELGIHGHAPMDEKSQKEENATKRKSMKSTCSDLSEKYGTPQEVIGKGAFGTVRVAHKTEPKVPGEKLFAVKEFKKFHNEPPKKYIKRSISEFCISSPLHHINIIDTIELLQDTQGCYCAVMEYCAGGDLSSLIASSGGLEQSEADCFFGQLINGVKYLHECGVAHRDLKLGNLVLTSTGCLKITDFGNGECFKMAWETHTHLSRGACGSGPYIAPEAFTGKWFDPRPVDVWACGIIYMKMITGGFLWSIAKEHEDLDYSIYLASREHEEYFLAPFKRLTEDQRRMMFKIIEPNPDLRITAEQITEDPWFKGLDICHKPLPTNNHFPTKTTCGTNATNGQTTNMNELPIINMA